MIGDDNSEREKALKDYDVVVFPGGQYSPVFYQ